MNKTSKILVLSSIILVGFAAAVIFHYILGFYLGLPNPFNTFLFDAQSAFGDFIQIVPFTRHLAPYHAPNTWISYFPLAYILLFPFSLIKNPYIAYIIYASGFLAFLIYMNIKNFACENLSKSMNFRNIFILTFLSYPVLYSLDKGNFDMFLFVLFALSIWAFKSKKYLLSAILFALQNAIKPFPILFLALFLYKKKYKEFFLSLVLTALMIIGGFMFLHGNLFDQIAVLMKNLADFKTLYVYDNSNNFATCYNSSLFMALRLLLCKFGANPVLTTLELAKVYNYIWVIITVLTLFFTWREKTFWKQVTLMSFYMLLMPYLIFDYKLIFLFVPIWLFVNSEKSSKFDLTYTILFALLFIPKHIVIMNPAVIVQRLQALTPTVHWAYFSVSTLLNPLIMLLFIGLIATEQWRGGNGNKGEIAGE